MIKCGHWYGWCCRPLILHYIYNSESSNCIQLAPRLSHPSVCVTHSWIKDQPLIWTSTLSLGVRTYLFCVWIMTSGLIYLQKKEYVSIHQNYFVSQSNEWLVGASWEFFLSKQLQLLSKANLAVKRGSRNPTDGNALL